MNFLVTGIASDIGFGAGRLLKGLSSVTALYGMDIQSEHAGASIFDQCLISPRANATEYVDWLLEVVERLQVDVLLPCSEAEISRLTAERHRLPETLKLLMLESRVASLCLDKHACLQALNRLGIAVPEHGLPGVDVPRCMPVVVKPRSGQGSKGLRIVQSSDQLGSQADFVWQAMIGTAEQEFTCPVYRASNGEVRVLVIRRVLQGGLTGRGEVVENATISAYVRGIVDALNLYGAANIQLRLDDEGRPLLFEINPRLSSTLVFRAKMGFTDLQWWLSEALGQPLPEYQAPLPGTKFFRVSNECIFTPEGELLV